MSEELEYVVDKTGWEDGPWMSEPDKLVWVDPETQLDCMIVRAPSGALCGYVGVKPNHPYHAKGYYEDDIEGLVDVPGGLTYSEHCGGVICHPTDEEDDPVWWFGFDCGHLSDIAPNPLYKSLIFPEGSYKDIYYVKTEIKALALQLKGVEQK
jgi:hypothetical protein